MLVLYGHSYCACMPMRSKRRFDTTFGKWGLIKAVWVHTQHAIYCILFILKYTWTRSTEFCGIIAQLLHEASCFNVTFQSNVASPVSGSSPLAVFSLTWKPKCKMVSLFPRRGCVLHWRLKNSTGIQYLLSLLTFTVYLRHAHVQTKGERGSGDVFFHDEGNSFFNIRVPAEVKVFVQVCHLPLSLAFIFTLLVEHCV